MNKLKEYRNFNEILRVKLKSPAFVVGYLNEALASKDKEVFLLALQHVFEVHDSLKNLDKDPKLSDTLDFFESIGIKLEFKVA